MATEIKITRVKSWQWVCPYCNWIYVGVTKAMSRWTAKYHLRDACPNWRENA